MIRNYFIYVLLLGVYACSAHHGNYDYQEINEIVFSNIKENYSVMMNVGKLAIEPDIEMTEGDILDTTRFEYVWIAVKGKNKDTLGMQKDLNCVVTLEPDTYDLYFKVKDRETDVVWSTSSVLTVGTLYSRGILLIGEGPDGQVEVQMLSMSDEKTVFCPDVLKNSGLPPLYGPVRVLHTGNSSVDGNIKLWVMTTTGAYQLDRMSMRGSEAGHFSSQVFTTFPVDEELTPVDIVPHIKNTDGSTGGPAYRAVVCSNGYVFCASLSAMGGDFFTDPLNRESIQSKQLVKASPYLFYALKNWNGCVWYDSDNNRFMRITYNGSRVSPLADAGGDVFPWQQKETGRTLLYGENTMNVDGGASNGNSFALMRDAAGNAYIYKFYVGSSVQKIGFFRVQPCAVEFNAARLYAFSSLRTVLLYVVDHMLYAYDYNEGNEKCIPLSDLGSDEITMLKFDTQIEPEKNALYIATYNPQTKGVLRKFYLGTNPDKIELLEDTAACQKGLTKIVNMSWRAGV